MPSLPELEQIRKTQIIDAAIRTIAVSGCANVKMDDIVQASRLSKGGIAHYFKSKEELFMAAFKAYFDQVFILIQEIMAAHEDPVDKLLCFDRLYEMSDPIVKDGYPILFDFMAISVHNPSYRKFFEEWINQWVALLQTAIDQGIQAGLFKAMDSAQLAQTISAIYQGIATRWFLGDGRHSEAWAKTWSKSAVVALLDAYRM